jgi:hypothetical protein
MIWFSIAIPSLLFWNLKAGGIAEAFYGGEPERIRDEVLKRLPSSFIEIIELFYRRYQI